MIMKTKFAVFAVALLSACMLAQQSANAIGLSIEVGDRPYYDGVSYWDGGYEFIWIPGHWNRHEWIHGRYERRGKWHKEHAREHRRGHHHDHDGDEHHDH